jgi:hypothetical protein
MPQFSLTRSIKARRDLEARLRRNKLLHARSAFVDRPDDGVRGRRLVPRAFPRRQASKCDLRKSHDARSAARPTRNSRPSGDSDDRDNGRAQKRSDSTMNYGD